MATSVLLVLASFVFLAAAWYWRQYRRFHIISMSTVMLFDIFFPVYLYLTHDWWQRLVVHGDIFSFLVWSHLMLVMVLYALYALQIMAGRALLKHPAGPERTRIQVEHHKQFMGVIVARILVLASGALLIVPEASL
ncbi:MAG: hypothetical protein R8K49_07850 [Mariprofundaceae bacterium]